MAQMNTRWYSGKISTSSPVGSSQRAKTEDPQNSRKQLTTASNGSTRSKTSLKRPAASSSRLQAKRNTGAESKHTCSGSECLVSPNQTSGNVCRFKPNNGAKNNQERQIDPIAREPSEDELNLASLDRQQLNEIKSSAGNVCRFDPNNGAQYSQESQIEPVAKEPNEDELNITSLDKRQFNEIKSAAATADLSYWFPYYFMQTLRHKLQDSASQLTTNRTIEVHYFQNDMARMAENKDASPEGQLQPSNCKRYGSIQIHRQISYKCPKKNPKFRAKFYETKKDFQKEILPSSNFEETPLNFKKNSSKSEISKPVQLNSSRDGMNKSSSSPSSNEQNRSINRNISPASNKTFKWPSDVELEINLASVTPSSISSTDTFSCTTSSIMSTLQVLEAENLTPCETPVSPGDHELYLAKLEQLKEQLMSSIEKSKEQRLALDSESPISSKPSSNEKSDFKRNEKVGISKCKTQTIENKIELPATDNSKHRMKGFPEKTKEKGKSLNHENKTQISMPRSQPEVTQKKSKIPKSNSSKVQLPTENILKDRFKRFVEESKSVSTSLDIEAASNESQSPIKSEGSHKKSQISESSSCYGLVNSPTRYVKNRLKSFIAETKDKSPSAETETTTSTGEQQSSNSPVKSKNSYESPQSQERSFNDKDQLLAIGKLKERLRRSINEFKSHRTPLAQEHSHETSTEVLNSPKQLDLSTDKTKDNSLSTNGEDLPTLNKSNMIQEISNSKPSKQKQLLELTTKHSKTPKDQEHMTKSRKDEFISPRDQTNVQQRSSFKESNRQRKTVEGNEQQSKNSNFKCSSDGNNLRHSKARTSLHFQSTDKENRSPIETSSLKQYRKHKKSNDNHNTKLTSATTRTRTTQTRAQKSDTTTKTKRGVRTFTKGTQCSNTGPDWLDDIATDSDIFSADMDLKTLMNPHTSRSEALSAVLKVRYKSLIERARGEFAWLQLKKERYKSKGLHERIAEIRIKQQRILKKMELERSMIQELLESALAVPYTQPDKPNISPLPYKTTTSKSAPNIGTTTYISQLNLNQRLERVEYMLAWNFKLDEKEADIAELENMLLDCNYKLDISPVTSTKSLLYRISKVETRLSRISEKLASLENSTMDARVDEDFNGTQTNEQNRTGSKLNQFWQRLTSPKHGKSSSKRRLETTFKHQFSSSLSESHALENFRKCSEFNESSSSQFVVYDPSNYLNGRQRTSTTDDDGIIVLYSPRVPSLNLNFSSVQSEVNEEEPSSKSPTGNATFSLSKRYTNRTTDRKSNN